MLTRFPELICIRRLDFNDILNRKVLYSQLKITLFMGIFENAALQYLWNI